jgi:Tol biopolymer transport system component
MKPKNFSLLLFLVIFPTLSLLGCTPKPYHDITNLISSQALPSPEGEYESVVWLDDDRIAFIYRPQELIVSQSNENFRIAIFEISSGKSKDMPLPSLSSNSYCTPERSWISELTKLPDGSLGFMFSCRSAEDTLYLLDTDTEVLTNWNTYYGILAKKFSLSPDMSRLIQEDGSGGGLSESLLLVSSDRTMKKLLPDYQRARSPVWAADGETIFFAGTKENSENAESPTWIWIEDLFFYPWDIYRMDSDGKNPKIVLPSVGTIYDLKFSPVDENLLLFAGTSFDKKTGIWLLDRKDLSVKRIWNENPNSYDWSPDGTKIVILNNRVNVWATSVTIINLEDH